jgi:cellulose synthase/poly-beta-1,6-N-acetylglucosamine synthase-like glycosyltransferase
VAPGHLTEDLATGMRFHAGRWESVYVPEPLAVGEGPATWASYFNQQYRWAFGCMNIFFTTHWPKVNLRMRITHALYSFLMGAVLFQRAHDGHRRAPDHDLLCLWLGPS